MHDWVPAPTPTAARRRPDGFRAPDATATLLALHQRVGNRAFSDLVVAPAIQRHEGPTTNEQVGGAEPAAAGLTEASPTTETEASVDGTAQPGTGTTGSAPAGVGLTGAPRTKAIEDTLRASATGMWALGILSKWKIPVDYEYTGSGSFHQDGKIFINKSLGVGSAALVMMHEAQHADTFKSGRAADRGKLTRAEYITRRIADEAEAVVRQIEGFAITANLGVDMSGSSGVTPELKQRYLTAFYAKRDELHAANPSMSTAEINAACRTHTRDGEVTKWFWDGTFVTSTDHNSYGDFYGKQWDDVHKAPGT